MADNNTEIKRVRYFDKQFLRKAEFDTDQSYHIEMNRRHNRKLHTWGVVKSDSPEGDLQVSMDNEKKEFTVGPGMAIDSQGREIVLSTPARSQSFKDYDSNPEINSVDVYISYYEIESDPENQKIYEGGQNTRILETGKIECCQSGQAPVGDRVLLASLKRDENGKEWQVDTSKRKWAGTTLSDNYTVNTLGISGKIQFQPSEEASEKDRSKWPAISNSPDNSKMIFSTSGIERLCIAADGIHVGGTVACRQVMNYSGFTGVLFKNSSDEALEEGDVVVIKGYASCTIDGMAVNVIDVGTTNTTQSSKVCGVVFGTFQNNEKKTVEKGEIGILAVAGVCMCNVEGKVGVGNLLVHGNSKKLAQSNGINGIPGAIIGKSLGKKEDGQITLIPILLCLG